MGTIIALQKIVKTYDTGLVKFNALDGVDLSIKKRGVCRYFRSIWRRKINFIKFNWGYGYSYFGFYLCGWPRTF